jgi:hypothetical protein
VTFCGFHTSAFFDVFGHRSAGLVQIETGYQEDTTILLLCVGSVFGICCTLSVSGTEWSTYRDSRVLFPVFHRRSHGLCDSCCAVGCSSSAAAGADQVRVISALRWLEVFNPRGEILLCRCLLYFLGGCYACQGAVGTDQVSSGTADDAAAAIGGSLTSSQVKSLFTRIGFVALIHAFLVSQVDLSISAAGLAQLDVMSASDPMAVLFEKLPTGGLRELGRTEVIGASSLLLRSFSRTRPQIRVSIRSEHE